LQRSNCVTSRVPSIELSSGNTNRFSHEYIKFTLGFHLTNIRLASNGQYNDVRVGSEIAVNVSRVDLPTLFV
jgi:hypothetical protein